MMEQLEGRWMLSTKSFLREAVALPGTIQIENYDRGGESVAYHDFTARNQGKKYRPREGVDVAAALDAGGGYSVLWTQPKEWLHYTINVAEAGYYDVDFRVASKGQGGTFWLTVDGKRRTSKIAVPDTGGARAWTTITRRNVYLPEGDHVLRLVMVSPGASGNVGSFNWLTFYPSPPAAPSALAVTGQFATGIDISWQDNSRNENGFLIERRTGMTGEWEQVASVDADVTSYSDSGLQAVTPYAYRVRSWNPAGESAYSDAVVESTGFDGPLVITRGGTYSGVWESTDPDSPAIFIDTDEPVIIENSMVRSAGHLIQTQHAGANLTIRNVAGYALNPDVYGQAPGRFLSAEQFTNVVVQNSTMVGTSGIYLYDYWGNGSTSQTVRILLNEARNIDGRHSDGAGGFLGGADDHDLVQFFQINDAWGLSNAEIAWNQVINEPGYSRVEDNISVFYSGGTAASPLRIHDNYIQGAYPANPATDRDYAGGGIMLSDVGAHNVHAFGNQVVSTTNYGIAISSGYGNAIYNNRILSSGLLPDGRAIPAQNVGAYIWNYDGDGDWSNNIGYGNMVGWMRNGQRNDWWVPDATSWSGNSAWGGSITLATEANEYTLWQQKLIDASLSVGATMPLDEAQAIPAAPATPTPAPSAPKTTTSTTKKTSTSTGAGATVTYEQWLAQKTAANTTWQGYTPPSSTGTDYLDAWRQKLLESGVNVW